MVKGYLYDAGSGYEAERDHVDTDGHIAVSGGQDVEKEGLMELL